MPDSRIVFGQKDKKKIIARFPPGREPSEKGKDTGARGKGRWRRRRVRDKNYVIILPRRIPVCGRKETSFFHFFPIFSSWIMRRKLWNLQDVVVVFYMGLIFIFPKSVSLCTRRHVFLYICMWLYKIYGIYYYAFTRHTHIDTRLRRHGERRWFSSPIHFIYFLTRRSNWLQLKY